MEKKIERLKIIDPFLKGEKTLREIEKETEVSYATLKRWIKSYKENGEAGLEIKQRADKSSFRKANDLIIEQIKDIYSQNKEKPLLEIYKKVKESIEEKMSFNTFYRVLSNLDSYLKNKTKFQINKNIKNGEVYLVQSFVSYHFVRYKKVKKLPLILLAFNAATLDFIDFHICFTNKVDNELLAFFRKFILKGASIFNVNKLPKEILLDSTFSIPKKVKEEIYEKTQIKLLEFEPNNEEINKFILLLKDDLNKTFSEETSYDEFKTFLENYSSYYNPKAKILLKDKDINSLNCFLSNLKRKVHPYGIQINNSFYNDIILNDYLGKTVDILYDPLNISSIFVNINDNYIKIYNNRGGIK